MKSVIEFLNTVFGGPSWKGISAIATIGVVILTYLSLRRINKERKIQLNRESIEKVYQVLLRDFKNILGLNKIETMESIYPSYWKWEEIKEKEPYIAYQVPSDLYKKLNEFSRRVEDYEIIKDSFKKKFENLLIEIVKSKKVLDQDKFEKIEDVRYFEGVGPTYKNISIYQLFFHSKNLKEFLGKDNLKGKFLIYFFNPEGRKSEEIDEEKFNKIFNVVNNQGYLFDYHHLAQEEFQKLFDFYQKMKFLKNEIEKTILQLTKAEI